MDLIADNSQQSIIATVQLNFVKIAGNKAARITKLDHWIEKDKDVLRNHAIKDDEVIEVMIEALMLSFHEC